MTEPLLPDDKNDTSEPTPAKLHKPKANLTTEADRIMAAAKELERKRQVLKDERVRLNRAKEALKIANGTSGLVDAGRISEVEATLATLVKSKDIFWQPHEGPQTWFLQASEDEVLFAGGRGSGKSDCLIADPLRYCGNPRFKGLVIRRTMPELRDLISRAKYLYPKAFPGVKWREQEKTFTFPHGGKIEFGYCESMDDAMRYQGQQYCWLGVDEVTQYGDEKIIDSIIPSLRSPDESLPIFIRYTCNPGGPGRRWVKERFVDLGPANTKVTLTVNYGSDEKPQLYQKTRRWIHSTVEDNPSLGDRYKANLASITDTVKKAQWLAGNWDIGDGTAFPEFSRMKHVVAPFQIPSGWRKFRGCDWGYGSLAVVEWIALDYDNNVYVYREFVANGPTASTKLNGLEFAKEVVAREVGENVHYGYLDSSVWSNRGEVSEPIAETMISAGCRWLPADRSPGSRISRKMVLHNFLAMDKLKIFNTCPEIIKELCNLTLDKNNLEDVDTTQNDHAYDALTYVLASLPNPGINYSRFTEYHDAPIVVNVNVGM